MYQRNGTYWYRVWTPIGACKRVSLETKDSKTAHAVCAWADEVRQRLDRHGVLAAVVDGTLTLPQAFVLGEADAARYLGALKAEASDRIVTDDDLLSWGKWVQGRGVTMRGAADYRRQLETLWPAPRLQSQLQARAILTLLEALPCKEQTKGRYRAAIGSLCQWLVRQGRLDVNPMPSVPGFAQSAPRDLWYSDADALRLLHALPEAQRGLEATMWACGWEWSAIERATVADFDLSRGTAFARGTKRASRQRLTAILCSEAVPMIESALKHKLPAAPVWAHLRNDRTLKIHQGVCRDLGLPVSTLHDWRHSFAVREIQRGRSLQFVAQMLGHANTVLVQRLYGRYVLSDTDVQAVAAMPRAKEA